MADQPPPLELCFFAIDHWSTCMTKAEWAAWAQVVGATVAIAAGAYGIAWQVKNQWGIYRRELNDEEAGAVADLYDLLEEGRRQLTAWHIATTTHDSYVAFLRQDRPAWRHTLELMRVAEINDIPGTKLRVAFRTCKEQFETAQDLNATAWQMFRSSTLPTTQHASHHQASQRLLLDYGAGMAVFAERLVTLQRLEKLTASS